MGLDQYAYKVKKSLVKEPFSLTKEAVIDGEFMYWRKNRHLQGFMEELFFKKCKEAGKLPEKDFNCIPMELTKEDIQKLMFTIRHGEFEDANGFFWGHGDYDKEQALEDLEFCERALKALEEDDVAIYYDCWY